MGKLISWLGKIFAESMSNLFMSWKMWLGVGFLAIVTVNLYNLYVDIMEEVLNFALGQIRAAGTPGGPPSVVQQVAGLAGFFAARLKVVECFSFVVNIVMLKWMLVKIPFLTW